MWWLLCWFRGAVHGQEELPPSPVVQVQPAQSSGALQKQFTPELLLDEQKGLLKEFAAGILK